MRDSQQIADALVWVEREAATMPIETIVKDPHAFDIVTATIEALKWALGKSEGPAAKWLEDAAKVTSDLREALSRIKSPIQ